MPSPTCPDVYKRQIYDGFDLTVASWISRYISVYLWLPIADLFSAVLAKIQTLMLQADVLALQDPNNCFLAASSSAAV